MRAVRKSVRSEVATALAVLSVPAAVAFVFPYEALLFRATEPPRREVGLAGVALTADQEAAAMRAAKTSWQVAEGGARRLRAEMPFAELPEAPRTSVLSAGERRRRETLGDMECGPSPYLPSRRAAPPQKIADGAAVAEPPPFSREELLKID